jgi:hypothetical protein
LGIRQGATENATVVGELLGDLVERGLDFITPRLYVLDGGKALTTAVKKYAGESAAIQRCQVHKRRNVLHRELMDLNPSAARSLGEGMEETLTVHRLHLPMQLRKTMASTRDRVGILNCGAGLPERKTLARQRPAGALGGVGAAGRGEAVSPSPGIQTDPGPHQRIGSVGAI